MNPHALRAAEQNVRVLEALRNALREAKSPEERKEVLRLFAELLERQP